MSNSNVFTISKQIIIVILKQLLLQICVIQLTVALMACYEEFYFFFSNKFSNRMFVQWLSIFLFARNTIKTSARLKEFLRKNLQLHNYYCCSIPGRLQKKSNMPCFKKTVFSKLLFKMLSNEIFPANFFSGKAIRCVNASFTFRQYFFVYYAFPDFWQKRTTLVYDVIISNFYCK